KPAECMVLEDAVAGIQAGKAAGMYCVGFQTTTTGERLKAAGADLIVEDFVDLINS
ncbi:MAG: hypothetical protein UY05_C0041G0012, partial [Candidatus Peregrinibacteria bacterium GW2011_GWA2_47_7]